MSYWCFTMLLLLPLDLTNTRSARAKLLTENESKDTYTRVDFYGPLINSNVDPNAFVSDKESNVYDVSSKDESSNIKSKVLEENDEMIKKRKYENYMGEDEEDNLNFSDNNIDEGSSNREKEETYASGVLSINELSKDDKQHIAGTTRQNKKVPKKKHEKTTNKPLKNLSSGIDLEYLQKLFNNKDIHKFHKHQNERINKKVLENFHNILYDNKTQLKLLKNFEQTKQTTQDSLKNTVEKLLKEEESSIRYKISFPGFYHSVGTITLPYDDLVEPFEAWYAGDLNMSRIDYYQGMDKSYQRGDIGKHGVVIKVTPAHWGKKGDLDTNSISCWYKEDNKWTNRRGQTVVPLNVKKFKYVGKERFNGVPTYRFTYEKRFVDKNNTYILHVTQSKPYKPLRYEMIGYDHLLRSHYDHYIIDYFSFEEWDFDCKVLQIPKKYKCYKQLAKLKSHFEANPMWDYLHSEHVEARERELTTAYEYYQRVHRKQSKSKLETHKRKDIFRHNSRFIHSHNRACLNYTLELNHLTDASNEEFEMMKGQPYPDTAELRKELDEIPQLRISIPKSPLPKNLDWREYGIVGKVHSQTFCASCWAFSAAGAIEGAFAIKNGSLEEISVQQLIDCSWGYDNNGCRGGWSWRAFQFAKDHGIATRRSYGKYIGQEAYCHCSKKDHCDIIEKISYKTIEKHNAEKLKIALAMYGPGSIAVQCARKTFKFYSSGVYDDPKCTQKTDHAVLVVGYGEENNASYWLIKNSWGTLWGNNGFMKISMKNDLCGVLNNGPLMVSVGGWENEKNERYLFTRLNKKQKRKNRRKKEKIQNEIKNLKESIKLREDQKNKELDLFVLPDHVTSYLINKRQENKK